MTPNAKAPWCVGSWFSFALPLAGALALAAPAAAQGVPAPLGLDDAIRIAAERRAEITAARARVRAAEQRPAIVSALEDPMVAASIDHLPLDLSGADYSVTIEQRFQLGPIRRHRRQAANAATDRARAEAEGVELDVSLQAANAFLMLEERRRTDTLLRGRLDFARNIVAAASARYSSGDGLQAEVLRAEVEVARLEAALQASAGQIEAAETMLNGSIGRDVASPVPALEVPELDRSPPSWGELEARLPGLPGLRAGRAEVARTEAEILVMRDMYRPMLTVRAGPSYTMADGYGVMGMVGVSIPLRRSRLRAGVAEATAMRDMAEAELAAMTRMAEAEAAQALAELRAASAQQNALRRDVLPRSRFAVEPALIAYATGRQPLASALEAVQALWDVEMELIEADLRVGRAWVRLGRALGSFMLVPL